jgi:hypothetical protein
MLYVTPLATTAIKELLVAAVKLGNPDIGKLGISFLFYKYCSFYVTNMLNPSSC